MKAGIPIGETGMAVRPERRPSHRRALAALSISMLMPSLDTSIANSALPALEQGFAASFQAVQWIVLAYLIAITSLIVAVGRFGDMLGRRRLLLAGIALFTAASILCGAAPSLWFLIAARTLQGLGAAVMMALALASVGDTVPKERTGSAMGLLGTMSAIGTTMGPSLGGFLIAGPGWRAIFLVNIPLGMLGFFLAYRYLPADRRQAEAGRARFDYPGMLALIPTLLAYSLGMTFGRDSFGTMNAVLLAAALTGAAVFVAIEGKTASPLIRLSLFRNPALGAGLALSALVSTVIMSTLVVGPFYLSRSLGLNSAATGLALSAGPLFAALAGVPAGRLVDRFGEGNMVLAGLIGMAAGCTVISLLPKAFGVPGYVGPIVCMTMSYALFQTANNTGIMAGISPDRRGVLSGMLSLSRNLGLITGASLMGALFASASAASGIPSTQPGAIAYGMRFTFAISILLLLIALAIAIRSRKLPARAAPVR